MDYKGTIIEESLENKEVLKDLKIIKTEIESVTKEHQTPWLKNWTMHTVEIEESKADEIAEKISQSLEKEHNWYADFKNNNIHFIIFRNKVFRIARKKEEYEKVKKYGVMLGIPDYQLDFSPEIN